MYHSNNRSETVNLVKVKKKKSPPASQLKIQEDLGRQTNIKTQTQATPAPSQPLGPTKTTDDTFSFTSCSLKKLLASESPKLMMALIVAVGTLTVILVLKCICCPAIISDLTQETRERRSNDAIANDERKPWEASKSKLMSDFSEFTGKDARETNLHGDAEYPDYLSPDLSSILDPIKVNEGYGSNNLRDFYRKLLKTDIQIKNLKKGFANIKHGNIDFTDPSTSRLKRSLKSSTSRRHTGSHVFNKGTEGNLDIYRPLISDELKTEKDVDLEFMFNAGSTLEKKKNLLEVQKFRHGYKGKGKEDLESEDYDATKNNIKQPFNKYTQWLGSILGRETPSTQHRRLLQHDDDEDSDETATEDYEEQTKEPWDRAKRTVNPLLVFIQTKAITTQNAPRTELSELVKPTPLCNDEINYLIDAALKLKSGKIDNMEHKEIYPNVIGNKEYFEDNSDYKELVAMAQAYSDYGVLNNKKEIIENNLAPGNTFKLITSEKPLKTVEWLNNFDNRHGQLIKLKSNMVSKMEKPSLLKKLRLKMFPKNLHSEIKTDDIQATTKPKASVNIVSNFTQTTTPWSKSNQKSTQKHKEHNVMFSGHRRSLKSVETDELNDDAEVTARNIEGNVNNTHLVRDNEEYNDIFLSNSIAESKHGHNNAKNDTINTNSSFDHKVDILKLNEDIIKHNDSNTTWGLGEIFNMLAEFCMFLAGFDKNQEDSGYRFLYDFVTMLNPNFQSKNKSASEKLSNETKNVTEALIDKEKVENIYRSRVLLSFEEPAEGAENVTSTTYFEKDTNESYVVTNKHANASLENKANSSNTDNKNIILAVGNRTVVKRSADGDSIFWNDMYDDEYGIKDPMEDDMKDKSAVKFNDLMGKDNWINTKFKKFAKSFKERRNRKMEKKKERVLKNARNKTSSHTKRSVPVPDDSGKHMFEGLTANMKRVCNEAAQAIHETTNREVRADSDQASTLMQQLVGLMSELVNLQVREKTCVQLPEDLRSFLAWLTSPNTEERNEGFSVDTYDSGPMSNLNSLDDLMLTSNPRSECLGTIHDVEDLILQYDEMSEEDKSKMSGVREYLEQQLHYLHKQLSNYNEYGSSVMYQEPVRLRRQPKTFDKIRKRKGYKLLNYYNKKHTKHTVFDDATEDYRSMKRNENDKSEGNDNLFENIVKIKDINGNRGLSGNVDNDLKSLNDFISAFVKGNNSFGKYTKM